MSKNRFLIALASFSLLVPASLLAADNMAVKDGNNSSKTLGKKDVGGVLYDQNIIVSASDPTIDVGSAISTNTGTSATNSATIATNTGTTATNTTAISGKLPSSLGAKTGVNSFSVVPASDGFSVSVSGISGTVSLPSGAATAAKQPALGTAGTPSADVITVQGSASGTNLNVVCQSGCSGGAQKAEDAASADADLGTVAMAVRKATPANTSGTDGDYEPLQISAGRLWTDVGLNFGLNGDATVQSGAGTAMGMWRSIRDDIRTMSTDTSTVNVQLQAGTNLAGKVGIDQTTVGTTNAVSIAQLGANTVSTGNGTAGTGTLRVSLASDSTGQVTLAAGTATIGATYGFAGTATTTTTRPADTSAYTANDAFANATSSAAVPTLSNMCRASGGSGIMTDFALIYSTTQVVVGEIWFYDSAPAAANNDNAAWAMSDSDQLKLIGKYAFTTVADASNSVYQEKNMNMGYTCSGSANLSYQIKITTGYTPAASDTLTLRAKFIQSN